MSRIGFGYVQSPDELVRAAPAARVQHITGQHGRILTMVAAGMTNKEIAVEMVLSEETIKSHVRNILSLLAARNRAHAVYLAASSGIIPLGEDVSGRW